jgi:hypothetical protein
VSTAVQATHPRGVRVNLMCGPRPKPGYVNLDMQPLPGVDVVYRIDPYHPHLPFGDDSVAEVYWNNGPEHVLDIDGAVQELWRVSIDGARWYLLTPGWRDPNSWNDPTHLSHWGSKVLEFYTAAGFDGRRYPPALISFELRGDDDHGLEFFVTAHKRRTP